MGSNSWMLIESPAFEYNLSLDLAQQDTLRANDSGWIQQMRHFITEFTNPGETILDPFCGFASTLVAAHLEQRKGLGLEVDAQRCEFARVRLSHLHAHKQMLCHGDITEHIEFLPQVDMVLTNLPYFGSPRPENKSDDRLSTRDSYASYLDGIQQRFKLMKRVLKPNGVLVIMVKNLRLGEHFIPLAWDVARLIADRFELIEERILLSEKPDGRGKTSTSTQNRSHEYALIARHAAPPFDFDGYMNYLRAAFSEFPEIIVYGSFARYLQGHRDRSPCDADLLVPADSQFLLRLSAWFVQHGFAITRWGAEVHPASAALAASQAHYLRAVHLSAQGFRYQFDLCFEDEHWSYADARKQLVNIDGLPLLPTISNSLHSG